MSTLITKYYIPGYLVRSTVILREEGGGGNVLSLPSTPGSSGELKVDGSVYAATYRVYNGGLPLHSTVRWEVTDEYVEFHRIPTSKDQ